jgi:ferritin-like metal-binding protein YciE
MSSQDKTLKARMDTLQQYVSDMIAVEEHISNAVKRQADDKEVQKHNPQAAQLIQHIVRHTDEHAKHLEQHLETLGGDPAKGLKEVATSALGAVAGMYDKVRTEKVSKMLRDDYTALNLAAVGYTMLHTTGLALQDHPTAAVALRHLEHYTSIIMELNQIIPSVVVEEFQQDGLIVHMGSAQQAVDNTQKAWQPSSSSGMQGNGGSRI